MEYLSRFNEFQLFDVAQVDIYRASVQALDNFCLFGAFEMNATNVCLLL